MADEKRDEGARPAGTRQSTALAELMEGAKALQAVQAQAAQEALRLPEPRLDEAQPGYHFLTADGRKVDANGQEVKGQALSADAEDALRAAGVTPERARTMSDDELDALPGVGPATVRQIRAQGAKG